MKAHTVTNQYGIFCRKRTIFLVFLKLKMGLTRSVRIKHSNLFRRK